ncbi:SpoIID/LytB domain-containing protein [Marinilabiliaceae bacterium N1Y90]|nr:SpoIID/LytB domain-containing protein [Marinilabiliaceae bacterium N1Y90]
MVQSPYIQIGIQFEKAIEFSLNEEYTLPSGSILNGRCIVQMKGNGLLLKNGSGEHSINSGTELKPLNKAEGTFTLHGVTIGINFHWERKEDQTFKGSLKLLIEDKKISAINILPLEDYLLSVISSEMSATSSLELLKAHAVISRSWLLAQIQKNKEIEEKSESYVSMQQDEHEHIKWYDREDHANFDVCADDHCQRYQGITRSSTKHVEQAIGATRGEVLVYDGDICDARFSKCCGGKVEVFEKVWEPVNHPYLQSFLDSDTELSDYSLDLVKEDAAQFWITGQPDAFCNTSDKSVLSQVLNDYDQETNDFYRWKQTYSQDELSQLVRERSGIDFGLISDLVPVERGDSGRLIKLKVIGDKRAMVIGKELEIRKTLSTSHLYSSAFVIEKEEKDGQLYFNLLGAGWGHGVGLCQIGAAVMGAKGYDYKAILNHYFRGATLNKRY